jgi:hypothetical protein
MAEKKVIELEVKTESLKPLKAQLREAQAEVAALAEKFGATSQEAVQAAKKAAELKDAIADAKNLTDAYNPDAKFNALSASISGVLNGFQAFEGALGLVGVEGEAVQATLLKVQSAMALTQGINGVLEAKEDFANLGKQITGVYEGAVKGFQNMTAAGKVFAITGIGLLITGLSLVITYWDDISKAIGITSAKEEEAAKKRSEYKKKQIEETKQYRDTISKESSEFVGLIYQLKQTNENTKQRKELIDQINNQYGTTLKNLKDEKSFQDQLNVAVNDYLNFQRAKYNLQKNDKERQRLLAKEDELNSKIASAIFDIGDAQRLANTGDASAIKILNEKNEKLKVLNSTLKYVQNRQEDIAKQDLELTEQTKNKYIPAQDAKIEKIKEVTKETENQTEALRDNNQELLDAGDAFAEAAKKRRDKTTQEMSDEEQARYDASVYWQNLKLDFAKQKTDEEIALEIKKRETTLQLATSAFSALGDLAGSFHTNNEKDAKKQFKIQKAFNLASAITNTALAITGALTAGGNPIKLATGQQFIEAAIAAVTGAAAITKITNTEYESASSGGGGGAPSQTSGASAGAGNVITPNFNIVGNAQATNPLAGLGGQPLQAYVVSGDVTTAQSLDRNRINYATFG